MITLTRPDGVEFMVRPDAVTLIEPASDLGAALKTKSRVLIGGQYRFVTESPQEVVQILEGRRPDRPEPE